MRGRDKLLEKVDGDALLHRQVARAIAMGCPVFVTLPAAPHLRYGALAGLDCTIVSVEDADEGMNASLRAGVAAVQDVCDAVMVLLADMPDIDTNDMKKMLQAVDLESETLIWRATTQDGCAGHPIIFHKTLFPALLHLSGDSGGSAVVKAHCDKVQLIALPDTHARTDLDTPEAWDAWRAGKPLT